MTVATVDVLLYQRGPEVINELQAYSLTGWDAVWNRRGVGNQSKAFPF